MKFNPHTNRLFTDNGTLIKLLHCPFRQNWTNLNQTNDPASRQCQICQHPIIDTSHKTDQQLLAIVKSNPHACLKVDLEQDNIIMIHQD
jgi:hypothetical protein